MKSKKLKPMYAQDLYVQRDDRFFLRTDSRLKELIKNYSRVHNVDMTELLNNTLIWVLCEKGIISLPYKKPNYENLESWWDGEIKKAV